MQKGAAGNRFCREVGHSVYLCQEKAIEADKGSEREKKWKKSVLLFSLERRSSLRSLDR
jgi:hypothetical protein